MPYGAAQKAMEVARAAGNQEVVEELEAED